MMELLGKMPRKVGVYFLNSLLQFSNHPIFICFVIAMRTDSYWRSFIQGLFWQAWGSKEDSETEILATWSLAGWKIQVPRNWCSGDCGISVSPSRFHTREPTHCSAVPATPMVQYQKLFTEWDDKWI